jgi:hypothetical protein
MVGSASVTSMISVVQGFLSPSFRVLSPRIENLKLKTLCYNYVTMFNNNYFYFANNDNNNDDPCIVGRSTAG